MQLLMDGAVHTCAQLRDLGWLRGESSQWGRFPPWGLPSVGMRHWWEVRGEPLSLRASGLGRWLDHWLDPACQGQDPGSALTSFVLVSNFYMPVTLSVTWGCLGCTGE